MVLALGFHVFLSIFSFAARYGFSGPEGLHVWCYGMIFQGPYAKSIMVEKAVDKFFAFSGFGCCSGALVGFVHPVWFTVGDVAIRSNTHLC